MAAGILPAVEPGILPGGQFFVFNSPDRTIRSFTNRPAHLGSDSRSPLWGTA